MAAKRKSGLGNRIAPPRFILFGVLFAAITGFAWWRLHGQDLGWAHSLMTGFDIAGAVFLVSLAPLLRAHSQAEMKRHAADNDGNRVILLVITSILSAVVLAAVFAEMNAQGGPNVAFIIATLAIAWLFGNMIYALHYAHVYFIDGAKGGLDFSGNPDCPDYWDFIYFAFTLGMTFQTSDTGITTRQLRRIVTIHSLIAFVFNIGILAFTINVLGSKGDH